MSFKPIIGPNGKTVIGIEFRPTLKMLRTVVEMGLDKNQGKSTEEILEQCGVTESEWKRWWSEGKFLEEKEGRTVERNYFEEWWDSALQIKSGEEREMLRQVGLQKALDGNFNFWKEMARTYGSVTEEPAEGPKKAIPFNLPTNATPEQLRDARQKLLESHRAVDDSAGSGMARLTAKRPKGPNR